ncbi:hypothetical protein H4S06_001546 [Coemansia sp. BCRC 34490]|nr:hypothetical protein H4S06_001546 [Coemansia sp. BCRC 34490]
MAEPTASLRILHFNDVYHVAADSADPVGGAARFKTLLQGLQRGPEEAGPTLTLFSGDAYFPSLESSVSRGEHMLPILNSLSIDASTFGNHEFDQGIDQLEHLIGRNNFPWVVTNLTDRETGGPAARSNSARYLVKQAGSLRIGIIGIVEKEWLDTLPCLPPTFEYHDFVESARDMATRLKQGSVEDERGVCAACDLVICLSHMRLPNDIKLADSCADVIDLVLSGHDHFYYIGSGVSEFSDPSLHLLPAAYSGHDDDARMIGTWRKERAELAGESQGRRLVKSGTDFRDLSEITLTLSTANGSGGVSAVSSISVTRHRVTRAIPEDPEVKQAVDAIEAHLSKAMDKLVGFTTTALDARSTVCRTRESNIGSFTGDLMRLCYAGSVGVEIGLLCGGAIRSDKVYREGAVRMRDIMEMFPFEDPVVVVRLTGDQIRRALENGVSKWPAQEGRFPQVSGIRFVFDPSREPGDRVTSIVLTASAKAAAGHAREDRKKSPAGSNNSTTQLSPSHPRGRSIASMHRAAVENAIGASGDTAPLRSGRRSSTDEAGWESESDADAAASDYGGEEDELLDMDAEYLVATRDYMYRGHDGYEVLTEGVLVVDEENGITFSDLYRRYFYGLAVCNAWSFKRHGLAENCSAIRHQLLGPSPGNTGGIEDQVSAGAGSDASNAKHSRWKQLIVKHADNLRQLAQQRRQQEEEGEDAGAADEGCQTLASRIASVVNQHHDSLATKAQLLTHRRSSVLRALLSSAKRLADDQTPMRVARTALFGHEDSSATPMPGGRESEADAQGVPRNDDANGLLPGMPINRRDTRSYASEGLIARWAVVSPQTDGRIQNGSIEAN